MAECPGCSALEEEQSSADHKHLKVKLKRSSASWEVCIDEEDDITRNICCEKGESVITAKKSTGVHNCAIDRADELIVENYPSPRNDLVQEIYSCNNCATTVDSENCPHAFKEGVQDNVTDKADELHMKSCPYVQTDFPAQEILVRQSNDRTTVDIQSCPSHTKEGVLHGSCGSEVSESPLLRDENSAFTEDKGMKESLPPDCGKVGLRGQNMCVPRTRSSCTLEVTERPISCDEESTLKQERDLLQSLPSECEKVEVRGQNSFAHKLPWTEGSCTVNTGGSGNGQNPCTHDHELPRKESCASAKRLGIESPRFDDVVSTHKRPRTADSCTVTTETSGNSQNISSHKQPEDSSASAKGSGIESPRFHDVVSAHKQPRRADNCTVTTETSGNSQNMSTQKQPRTADCCTEGPGNDPPRLDAVRERCRQLLVQAFNTETQDRQLVTELATSIEDHIFCEFKNTGTKYKNRVRSRVANLRDPQNPDLRRRLVEGHITPQQMATMSAEEMASEDVKRFRWQVSEESIHRRQVPHADGIMTDMFKCENCGRENCCYNQYRGFSADGPIASPFVFCMECGNRWKFF